MSDGYKDCLLRYGADAAIKKPMRELCLALIDTEDNTVINVYSPGTFWPKAIEGAKHFECGYGVVICDVSYEVLPLAKTFRSHSELSTDNLSAQSNNKPVSFTSIDEANFKDMAVLKTANRKFSSHGVTNFLGIKAGNEIKQVFPRGTPVEQISAISRLLGGDIVMVKAKSLYEITGLAKIEKTHDQLKQK